MPVTWQDARRSLWRSGTSPVLASLWTAAVGDTLAAFVEDDRPPSYGDDVTLVDPWRFVRPSEPDLRVLMGAAGEPLRGPHALIARAEVPERARLAAVPVRTAIELRVLATYAASLPYALGLPALAPIHAQGHGLDEFVRLDPGDPRVAAIAACLLAATPIVGLLVNGRLSLGLHSATATSAHEPDRTDDSPRRGRACAAAMTGLPLWVVDSDQGYEGADLAFVLGGQLILGPLGSGRPRAEFQRAAADPDPPEVLPSGPLQLAYARSLRRWADVAARSLVNEPSLPELAVRLVRRLRDDTRLVRKPGIRAAMAVVEVSAALGAVRGGLSRADIEDAAQVALLPRVTGTSTAAAAGTVVRDATVQVLYGLPMRRPTAPSARFASTSAGSSEHEAVDEALWGLWRAVTALAPAEADASRLDLSRLRTTPSSETAPSLAAAARKLGIQAERPTQPVADYLVGRGMLSLAADGSYSLTAAGTQSLRDSVVRERGGGRLRPDEAAGLLALLDGLDLAPTGSGPLGSTDHIRRVLHEVMAAQDSIWSGGVTPRQMAVHYLRRPPGAGSATPSLRYHTIRAIVDELAARGYLATTNATDGLSLTAEAVRLVSLDAAGGGVTGQLSWRGPKSGSRDGARVSTRHWQPGDIQRDVDLPATVGAAALAGRAPAEIERGDLSIAVRASGSAPDTVLCVDVSGSMGRDHKLASARSAAAAIASETTRLGGRVGVVAFDDAGRSMAGLTRIADEAFGAIAGLRAGANTNVADGLRSARSLAAAAGRDARVFLLTDGLPSAVSSSDVGSGAQAADLCERLATSEARRIARSGARLSVLLIGDEGAAAVRFGRRLALAGRGQLRRLRPWHQAGWLTASSTGGTA